jgi:hypothetical protein
MAKKINIVGATPKRIEIVDRPKRRIEPAELAAVLGAQPCGQPGTGKLDPIALAELGTQLLSRLRSSGGRPALADATEICRVPLSAEDISTLEKMADQLGEKTGANPSSGQLASVIVHNYLAEAGNAKKVPDPRATVRDPKENTMRKQFSGYYRPKAEELAQKFKECVFVLDTNVLLHLYRYTPETRDNLISVLHAVKDRVWIPHQVGQEYHENRVSVIVGERNIYQGLKEAVDKSLQELNKNARPANFMATAVMEPMRKALEQVKADLDKKEAEHPDFLADDPILEVLTELFDGKIGEEYDAEENKKKLAEAKRRFEIRTPPGYLDGSGKKKKEGDKQYGDVILWLQLLDFARITDKPMVFITDEGGEDWWQREGGRTIGPRPELLQEMHKAANAKWFFMYSVGQFLELSTNLLEVEVKPEAIKEANELKKVNDERAEGIAAVLREIQPAVDPYAGVAAALRDIPIAPYSAVVAALRDMPGPIAPYSAVAAALRDMPGPMASYSAVAAALRDMPGPMASYGAVAAALRDMPGPMASYGAVAAALRDMPGPMASYGAVAAALRDMPPATTAMANVEADRPFIEPRVPEVADPPSGGKPAE